MYTVLLIANNSGGQTFTLSRPTNSKGKRTLYRLMRQEGQVSRDEINTILLFRNSDPAPEVVKHWSAENGDFENL